MASTSQSYGATSASASGIARRASRKPNESGVQQAAGQASGNGAASEAPKPVSKVEPKVFLASERTFFSWIRVALLLGSFALALFNSGDSTARIMGLVYAGISLLAVAYAYAMHIRRSHRIRTTYAGHFDELYGPTMICVLLFAAVLANFIIRVKHHNGKMKTPKSPWLAAYLGVFVDMHDNPNSTELHF